MLFLVFCRIVLIDSHLYGTLLTGPISKWQTLGTRTKLSFGSTPMANQTYPQDGLMCGLKLFLGDHSQRNRRFKFFPIFWEIFF